MTIERGQSWGTSRPRPADLRVGDSDAALVAALGDGSGIPVAAGGGDLARTLGVTQTHGRPELTEFPLDLVEVTLDDGRASMACAHVVVRGPWWRGSWWHGSVLMVMNVEFRGRWVVAPRGHPNDGRVETLECSSGLSTRQRYAVWRRLANGSHLPHPQIATGSVQRATWSFAYPMVVEIDGRRIGRSRTLDVVVRPDAAHVFG